MWKTVFGSAIGTSHQHSEQPCQDACRVEVLNTNEGDLLVACLSDGAGSAEHSNEGSKIACDTFIQTVSRDCFVLSDGELEFKELIRTWCGEIRSQIDERANELGVEKRQLACTFLGAVVGESKAFFCQIGDGAIVRAHDEGYSAVFWPQSGEYANTTNFLTDEKFKEKIEISRLDEAVDELAIFTDGLERLILKFADQSVHSPFLSPLFAPLRATEDPCELNEPLQVFLGSPKINERTDDDKTLILATRLKCPR